MASVLTTSPSKISKAAVEDSLLGIKTSAAFLSSLANNLCLESSSPHLSPASSPLPTLPVPLSDLHSHAKSPPLKLAIPPLVLPLSSTAPATQQPTPAFPRPAQHRRRDSLQKNDRPSAPRPAETPHSAHLTHDPTAIAAAQQLLVSSVSEQSTLALRSLATSPLNLVILLVLLFTSERCIKAVFKIHHHAARGPLPATSTIHMWATIGLVWASLGALALLFFMVQVRQPYVAAAASASRAWQPTDDILVVHAPAACADAPASPCARPVLGMLHLEYTVREAQVSKGKRRRTGRGLVRGWAVAPGARRAGLGAALLREAARLVASRGGDGLWFAESHAHAHRVLPALYGGAFERRDRRAQRLLAELADDVWGPGGTRRRGSRESGRG